MQNAIISDRKTEVQNFDLPSCANPSLALLVDTRDRNARGALTSEFHVESFASAATSALYIPFLRNSQ